MELHIAGDATDNPFVSRGGLKLRHALEAFGVDVGGMRCADFGCNVGGFTDCLLQRGAAHVIALDTGYGTLAWKLRQNARVKVRERENALHAAVPGEADRVDLVVIDMGWTPQRLCVPVAVKWLKPAGRIITLVKPHYEVVGTEKSLLREGVLSEEDGERVARRTIEAMSGMGVRVLGDIESPIVGGKTKGNVVGNREWLVMVEAG